MSIQADNIGAAIVDHVRMIRDGIIRLRAMGYAEAASVIDIVAWTNAAHDVHRAVDLANAGGSK